MVLDIDLGAMVNQQVDNLRMPIKCGKVKRSAIQRVLGVDFASAINDFLNFGDVIEDYGVGQGRFGHRDIALGGLWIGAWRCPFPVVATSQNDSRRQSDRQDQCRHVEVLSNKTKVAVHFITTMLRVNIMKAPSYTIA